MRKCNGGFMVEYCRLKGLDAPFALGGLYMKTAMVGVV